MTKQEAITTIKYFYGSYLTEYSEDYDKAITIALECISESITAEELKNDLLNEFEGVPI